MNPLADSDNNVRALTRDGEMSLSVVLLDTDGKLLYDPDPLPQPDAWIAPRKFLWVLSACRIAGKANYRARRWMSKEIITY